MEPEHLGPISPSGRVAHPTISSLPSRGHGSDAPMASSAVRRKEPSKYLGIIRQHILETKHQMSTHKTVMTDE